MRINGYTGGTNSRKIYFIAIHKMRLSFHTEEECKCGGLVDHMYNCTCQDYWGYCRDPGHNWFQCTKCGVKVPKPDYKETRRPRTDPGTPEEIRALLNLMDQVKEGVPPLSVTSDLGTITE